MTVNAGKLKNRGFSVPYEPTEPCFSGKNRVRKNATKQLINLVSEVSPEVICLYRITDDRKVLFVLKAQPEAASGRPAALKARVAERRNL